jgi:hypothetical protein
MVDVAWTSDDDCSATFFAQTTPDTFPRTTTCWPATMPVTLPRSPTIRGAARVICYRSCSLSDFGGEHTDFGSGEGSAGLG